MMHTVYILNSTKYKNRYYKGYTTNIKSRLKNHNDGRVPSTKSYKPWKIAFFCIFQSKKKALDFEKYLKSSSGIAFMRKRLI